MKTIDKKLKPIHMDGLFIDECDLYNFYYQTVDD